MTDLPEGMLREERKIDPVFSSEEYLFRRVPLYLWDDPDDEIGVEAIELPDISVMRSKYAHPEWVRLEKATYSDWGVIGFQVKDIPTPKVFQGTLRYHFKAVHAPERKNYPHSEVQAYEENLDNASRAPKHIGKSDWIDPRFHLQWREELLQFVEKIIAPRQKVDINSEAPEIAN